MSTPATAAAPKRPSIFARLFGRLWFGKPKPLAQRTKPVAYRHGNHPLEVVAGDPPTGSRDWDLPPIHVQSSNLSTVAYKLDGGILEVAFLNGSVYHYAGVPVWKYQGLMGSASKGAYLHAQIKTPKGAYAYKKVV